MENKQKRMADEMDINLEVFNLETDFFGDLHCNSRFTDMLCDAQAQYQDYSELDINFIKPQKRRECAIMEDCYSD